MKRILLTSLSLAALAAASWLNGASPASAKRPNIVLMVSDDHGIDDLGCYGNPVVQTPHLDRLAADGTRFTSAFCTTASCSPSRSVILTGLHNHRNGMYGLEHTYHHFQSFDHVRSLPVMLAEAGYRTARVGKYHIAPESVYRFQHVLSEGAANDPKTVGRSPVEMAELSRSVIEEDSDRPFFLYYATDDPHRANLVLPSGAPTFESYPEPNDFGNRPEGYPGIDPVTYRPDDVVVPAYLPDTPVARAELAEYYQSVSRLDQGIGRLLQILEDAGMYENTLIIYISDNGPAFAGAKTTLYEPGIRLPCIIRAPGRRNPGSVQDAMISWTDLTPTILDAAGALPKDVSFDGRSFLAGVDGQSLAGWGEVYGSHTFHEVTLYYPMRMVRTRRYKLIHNVASDLTFPSANDLIHSPTWISVVKGGKDVYGRRTIDAYLHRPKFELYDLERDPHEVNNLADSPGLKRVQSDLVAKLQDFQEASKDPWIRKWKYE